VCDLQGVRISHTAQCEATRTVDHQPLKIINPGAGFASEVPDLDESNFEGADQRLREKPE